jgi:hypothetical protein
MGATVDAKRPHEGRPGGVRPAYGEARRRLVIDAAMLAFLLALALAFVASAPS